MSSRTRFCVSVLLYAQCTAAVFPPTKRKMLLFCLFCQQQKTGNKIPKLNMMYILTAKYLLIPKTSGQIVCLSELPGQ